MLKNTKSTSKHLLERLFRDHMELRSKQMTIDQPTTKRETDSQQKLLEVYESYKFLETLYKEEHTQVLSLSDENLKLQSDLREQAEKLKNAETRIQELASHPQQQGSHQHTMSGSSLRIEELENTLRQEREAHREMITRLGLRRKELEDLLVDRDTQIVEAEKKIKELDVYTSMVLGLNQQYPQIIQQYLQTSAAARVTNQQRQ